MHTQLCVFMFTCVCVYVDVSIWGQKVQPLAMQRGRRERGKVFERQERQASSDEMEEANRRTRLAKRPLWKVFLGLCLQE